MKILGFEIRQSSALQKDIEKSISGMKKELNEIIVQVNDRDKQIEQANLIINGMRPAMDFMDRTTTGGVQLQRYPNYSLSDFYDLVYASDTLYTVISSRTRAVFRNGYEVKEVFARKCPKCLTEYETDNEECDECGAKTIEPDKKQRKDINILFNAFKSRVNTNNQSMQIVQEAFDFDINVVDDGFIICLFDYTYDTAGKIVKKTPREIIRSDPRILKIIAGPDGTPGRDAQGKMMMFCPQHRYKVQDGTKCSECGKELHAAYYAAINSAPNTQNIYYMEEEVVHRNKFHPSMTYGVSPVFKVWVKIASLMAQDKYICDYYVGQKPPKGALVFDTNDIKGLQGQIDASRDNKNRNPSEPLYLGVTRSAGSGPVVTQIDLMKSLDEMQYIECRQEFRATVGAVWQVMPIFQGDLSQSGGLNNEGLQITVTGSATEADQLMENDVLREIVKKFGITDYTIKLKPFEEKDEMAEIQRDIARADHATRMQQLGYKVKMKPDSTFEFEGEEDGGSLKNSTQEEGYAAALDAQQGTDEQPEGDKKFAANYAGAPVAKSEVTIPAEPPSAPPVEIEKKDSKDSKEIRENAEDMEDELSKELRKILRKIDFKKNMSQEQIKRIVNEAAMKIGANLRDKSNAEIKKIYRDAQERVEKELNLNIVFGKRDENAIEALKNDDIFKGAFDRFENKTAIKLQDIITEAYENPEDLTLDKMVKNMRGVADESEGHLMNIARTESNHISNIAREYSYSQVRGFDNALFKWIGPDDDRTTDTCKAITRRTANGVTLSQLKDIVREESEKRGFTARDYTPHFQCRHTYILKQVKRTIVNPLPGGSFEVIS